MSVEQPSLFSKRNEWTDYMSKRMEESWAGYFRTNIMPNIDEEIFNVLYADNYSRPNTPVNYLIGLEIIKKLEDLSDERLLDSALFNEQVQYALGTIDYDKQPISKNMPSDFRCKIYEYEKNTGINLYNEALKDLNDKLIELSSIDTSLKRVDSLMISSSCKKMTRTELIYRVNERLIKVVDKLEIEVIEELKDYLNKDNSVTVLYKTKESEIGGKLTMLLNHSLLLFNEYKDNQQINQLEEFKQLERLINDQYDSDNKKPKSGKEIKPTSMQTPYDKDATYRYKYDHNIGYVGNVVEAVDKEKDLALITDWAVDQNVKSDKEFMEEMIEKKKEENPDKEETHIVDAAYFSTELNNKASEANIQLHPTDMTGQNDAEKTNVDKFEVTEDKTISKCPNGIEPIESHYSEGNKTIYADFDKEKCEHCPQRDVCAVKFLKTKNKLMTSIPQIEMAKVRASMDTDEYKELSKLRSGVEGIPSVLRRKYNIDDRPTKGVVYLGMAYSTAMISINIKRLTKYTNKQKKKEKNKEIVANIVSLLRTIFLF